MVTIKLRPGIESDGPAICALLQGMVPLLVPDLAMPGAAAFLESLEAPAVAARLTAPNYIHFIAESGGDLRAYISLRDGRHLYHLFVKPGFQGQGIGRLLWQRVLAVAGQQLITVNSSLPAVPVYRSFGFTWSIY